MIRHYRGGARGYPPLRPQLPPPPHPARNSSKIAPRRQPSHPEGAEECKRGSRRYSKLTETALRPDFFVRRVPPHKKQPPSCSSALSSCASCPDDLLYIQTKHPSWLNFFWIVLVLRYIYNTIIKTILFYLRVNWDHDSYPIKDVAAQA